MARMSPKAQKTGDQIASNWVAAMQSGTTQTKYKAGIAAFQGNPMALAASPAAMDKWLRNVQNSVQKRITSLNAADPANWKNQAMTLGATGLGTGATKKKGKMTAKMNKWAPIYAQASAAAAAVPDDGGMNIGKIQAALQVLKAAKGT